MCLSLTNDARPPLLQLSIERMEPLPLGSVMLVRMPDGTVTVGAGGAVSNDTSHQLACAVILCGETSATGTAIAHNVHHTVSDGAAAETALHTLLQLASHS